MYIDTSSYKNMLKDACKYFDIEEDDLSDFFKTLTSDVEGGSFNEAGMGKLRKFISENLPKKIIDEILFYHFTWRLKNDNDISSINLFDLLTNDNAFTRFFAENNIKFKESKNHVEVFYKDTKIDLSPNGNDANYRDYLRRRLGYIKDHPDFNLNGYILYNKEVMEFYKNELKNGPEFVVSLLRQINKQDVLSSFSRNSEYAIYKYRIPFKYICNFHNGNNGEFNDKKSLYENEKIVCYLQLLLKNLYFNSSANKNKAVCLEEPWCHLNDGVSIDEKYFVDRMLVTE